MANGWNLLTSPAALARKVREIRNDELDENEYGVQATFWTHELDPLVLGVEVEEEVVADAVVNVDIVRVPTKLFLGEGTRWHPTGETYQVMIEEEMMLVPCGRQIPNLVTAEVAAAAVVANPGVMIGAKHEVDDGPEVINRVHKRSMPGENVTQAELEMARAEAKAMKARQQELDRGPVVAAVGTARSMREWPMFGRGW
ncbi:hypothetical protein [Mesorhizobium kowhaii]|uniref:Uncharacterized protein n=1 Tax=Mesorhizobium kowhaii TaxID=1300272 RepID=A0A2W7C1F0_9HYPH|nr:hypothetical protein [Mesorhizobium kowhaii]PZV36882.1 hypothetical protein B5V02_19465 [Mesorhizobium kowhaii]